MHPKPTVNWLIHYFSKLHRLNVRKNAVQLPKPNLEDFKRHFEVMSEFTQKEIIKNKDNVYWQTAKEELDENDYKKLERSIYENRKPRTRQKQKPDGRSRITSGYIKC